MTSERLYNPLDKANLGQSVSEALLARPIEQLPPSRFEGAGIYAIYYSGGFKLYEPIAKRNADNKWKHPIYIGKAVPSGARKGQYKVDAKPGVVMWTRLRQHADSIKGAANLNREDFRCRYLVADDIWIPLGESMLISRFSPLWNLVVEGFGIHPPGTGREMQKRSLWDMLHPGRSLAQKLPEHHRKTAEIEEMVKKSLTVQFQQKRKKS